MLLSPPQARGCEPTRAAGLWARCGGIPRWKVRRAVGEVWPPGALRSVMRKGSAARTAEQGWELPTAPPPPVSSFLTTRCFPRQSREMVNAGGAPGAAPWLRPPPLPPRAGTRRGAPGCAGTRRSGAGRVRVPLGALFSVCVPISVPEEQTGKWFSAVSLQLTNTAHISAAVAQLSPSGGRGAGSAAHPGALPRAGGRAMLLLPFVRISVLCSL